jgi:hypothetical protein
MFAAGDKNPGRNGIGYGITLHWLQQVSETQAGREFARESPFIVVAAGVKKPSQERGLLGTLQ